VLAGVLVVSLLAGLALGPAGPAAAYPTAAVMLEGHGYGHGIGMGQWGSLGYAIGADDGAGNYTYQEILDHYYGGTTMETLGSPGAPTSLHGGDVVVAMTENDDNDLIATAESGDVNYPGGTAAAVLFRLVSPGDYTIFTSAGCAGPSWTQVATGVDNPTAVAANDGPVVLCEAGGSPELHGSLTAVTNSDGLARTVNTLPLEQYVADVAPAESPSTWADLGGAGPQGQDWGFQQSEAQTVAARSYVEAAGPLGYYGYADTCDQTCQSYPGMKYENPTSTAAALDTAGQVMVENGTTTVATTEYSASSGGYSTGDQFPAVVDAGDAVCVSADVCNPNHDWTASLPVSSVQAMFPSIGTLTAVDITSRNGLGDWGGRVDELTVAGTAGSVQLTGDEFAADFNLKSDWFTLADQPSGGVGGYWVDAADGGIFSFGNASFHGSMGGIALNQPMVGMAATHDAGGYWEVAADGGIFSFGDAHFYGSTGGLRLNKPVVGMAVTPDGLGYWLVASDGGIFSYGDARFYGSTGSLVLNRPIVGMVPTHDGGGYWLVASDGGIFAFGDATFHGSLGSDPPATPIAGVAPTADGGGYYLLEAGGTVHSVGDAPVVQLGAGSPGLAAATSPMTGMVPDVTGQGFDAVDQGGQVFAYGDAPYFGDVTTAVPGYTGDAVGMAATPG
jgi:SpoIID/LytB domain protein